MRRDTFEVIELLSVDNSKGSRLGEREPQQPLQCRKQLQRHCTGRDQMENVLRFLSQLHPSLVSVFLANSFSAACGL